MNLLEKVENRAQLERQRLADGQRPTPRFANKLQRVAFRALAAFFVLVLAFTLISRAAVGVAVARVDVKKPMTGILTQRTTLNGTITAQGDLELTLPGGIRITSLTATVGQRVAAGAVLLELDIEGLNTAIADLRADLALLDLKISGAAKGNTGADTDNVISAQVALAAAEETLKNAQEDYERLAQGRTTAEERVAEDLVSTQADYDRALAALEKAKTKAKTELVAAAREKVDAAREALVSVEESARDAINAATDTLGAAQDQESTADGAYYSAINAYNRAKSAYDSAVAGGDPIAISAAQATMDQAENSMNSLADASNNAYRAIKRAKEALETTTAKWNEKVEKAKVELAGLESKLTDAQSKTDMTEEGAVPAAQSAVDSAQRAMKAAQRGIDDAATATDDQLLSAQRGMESAQRGVDSARRSLEQAERAVTQQQSTNESTRRQAEVERLGYVNERRALQKKLDDLRTAAQNEGKLLAPVAGSVLYLPAETGMTSEGTKVATLSRSDRGFEFKGKMDQKTAEKLAAGDQGTLSFTSDGKTHDLRTAVATIGMADETGMVEVAVLLPEGNYPTGAAAKFELTKRSEQYPVVLPLGALRNDGEDYVLVLREKQTVMGLEQTVEKVPVTVTEQDSESMAVSAPALAYDAMVVVSTNKPIGEGDRVRVNENQ